MKAKALVLLLLLNPTSLYRAALHCFALVRSGVAINDAATGIRHPASHLTDATPDGRSLAGGWYNAGDYGKWTMMAAISTSYMLHLYRMQRQPDPVLRDEADWGLRWLLKMQDPDGGVLHKIDSEPDFAWGLPPQKDPYARHATPASTLDTADFAAVMYQASRACAPRDPQRAAVYRAAADRAFQWLEHHSVVQAKDPYYPDDDASQEVFWAYAERHLTAPDAASSRELHSRLGGLVPEEVRWSNPSMLGLFSLASAKGDPLQAAASRLLLRAADRTVAIARANPFGGALAPDEYVWGSAEKLLHRAAVLEMAASLRLDPAYREVAAAQLEYLLGHNALGRSLVTGFGAGSVQHPYHWTYMALGKVMPGWASGGPNGSPAGADKPLLQLQRKGTAADQCFLDLCTTEGSWASNEGEISENAALVFVTGMQDSRGGR